MTIHELLKHYWGYASFRPTQEQIIESIMQGRDTLAVMPTGGGKSICYQLPALAKEGVTIVISPLIALMQDQVENLRRRNIRAGLLHSGQNSYERMLTLNQSTYGDTKILYISPERIDSSTFIAHYREMHVAQIVVDEAHCISQWGHDFRPHYLKIRNLRQYHNVPIIAVTATAKRSVIDDIEAQLEMRKPVEHITELWRPNLAFAAIETDDLAGRLLRIVKSIDGTGIVYCHTRRESEQWAYELNHHGIAATYYNAGLDRQRRTQHQQQWMKGQQRVMVATSAFGMGIDKADVRFVVHIGMTNTVEQYYQEAGRAGRDGQPAYAILLYPQGELSNEDSILELNYPPINYLKNIYTAVCNSYNIPIGIGRDRRFDFDIEKICRNYNFDIPRFYHAAQHLANQGLWTLPETGPKYSKVRVIVTREELYNLEVSHPPYRPLIDAMLRQAEGLFTHMAPIYEQRIARTTGLSELHIVNQLHRLHEKNIIEYEQKSSHPQIIFTQERLSDRQFASALTSYSALQSNARSGLQSIRHYATTAECRQRWIARFFDRPADHDCGRCDNCRHSNKPRNEATAASNLPSLREAVLAQLKQSNGQLTVQQLADLLQQVDTTPVANVVRELLDENQVRMDTFMRLSLA